MPTKRPITTNAVAPIEAVAALRVSSSYEPKVIAQHQDMAPPKTKADREGKELEDLTLNIFSMEVTENKKIFPLIFSVTAHNQSGKELEISKGPRDDASRTQRDEICRASLRRALEKCEVLKGKEAVVSDGVSLLFSTVDLHERLRERPGGNRVIIDISELPINLIGFIRLEDPKTISIDIQKYGEFNPFNVAECIEYLTTGAGLAAQDNSILQFLDILTNEPAIRHGYIPFGKGRLFPRDAQGARYGRGGQKKVHGLDKGICTVETAPGRFLPAISVDVKVAIFLEEQPLVDSVRDLCGRRPDNGKASFDFNGPMWKLVDSYVKGIRLSVSGTNLSFLAAGISKCPTAKTVQGKGSSSNLFDPRRFGHWPAVKCFYVTEEKKEVEEFFPMDVCIIAKNQRVPITKQDKPPVPMKVQERFGDICGEVRKIYCDKKSELEAFGLRLQPKPVHVTAIRRKLPQPLYANGNPAQVNGRTGDWKVMPSHRFAEVGKVDFIIIAHDCSEKIAKIMLDDLSATAKKHGIMAKWALFSVASISDTREKIKAIFSDVKEGRGKKYSNLIFLFYLDYEENKKSHNILKLYERLNQTHTQHVHIETVAQLEAKKYIANNILSKTNCKLGGINYLITPEPCVRHEWISNGRTLVIGYDVSHPTGIYLGRNKVPANTASVVGMSFNGSKNPESFIGDFHYQAPLQEEVTSSLLEDRISWILELFTKHRGLPEKIVILRDGVSQGQYAMVLNREYPSIQEGVKLFKEKFGAKAKNWNPKFFLSIITKRHNRRLVKESPGGRVDNALIGTVADDKIVRPDITHFYLQSHHVRLGTGKMCSYTVMVDETGASQDELQAFMLSLAFEHQIVQGGISLPEPVYQADQYATRGMNLWATYEDLEYHFKKLSTYNQEMYSAPPIDYEEMTRRLAYRGSILQNFRINA